MQPRRDVQAHQVASSVSGPGDCQSSRSNEVVVTDSRSCAAGWVFLLTVFCAVHIPAGELIVPADTELSVRILEPLSTDQLNGGEFFRAELDRPLRLAGQTIPSGTSITGQVAELRKPKRVRRAKMVLTLTEIEVGGKTYPLATSIIRFKGRLDGSIVADAYRGAYAGAYAGALIDEDNQKLRKWAAVTGAASALLLKKRLHIALSRGEVFPFRLDKETRIAYKSVNRVNLVNSDPDSISDPDSSPDSHSDPSSEPDTDTDPNSDPDPEPHSPCDPQLAVSIVEMHLLDAGFEILLDGVWDAETERMTYDFIRFLQLQSTWSGPVDGEYSEELVAHLQTRLHEMEPSDALKLQELLAALDCLAFSEMSARLESERCKNGGCGPGPGPDIGPVPGSGQLESDLKMAFLAYANGFLYDFADDIWCKISGEGCIERIRVEALSYRERHSRTAWILYVLGALTSPFALGSILIAKQRKTLVQSFQRGFLIEAAEGVVAAGGEALTFGGLINPLGFTMETFLFSCVTGALMAIKLHWRKLIWHAIGIAFVLVLLLSMFQP